MSCVFGSTHHVCTFLMLRYNHKGKQDTTTPLPDPVTIFCTPKEKGFVDFAIGFLMGIISKF